MHKTLLPNTKKLTVTWSKKGAGQTGARHFKYFDVPPLKYWNKSLEVALEKDMIEVVVPKVTVELSDGATTQFSVKGLTNQQILELVAKADPQGEIVTKGPGHLISLE